MIEFKRIDTQGRVVLPPAWRKKLKSNEVFIVEDGEMLLVVPKTNQDIRKYFDLLKIDVPPDIYADYHRLKNYLLSKERP